MSESRQELVNWINGLLQLELTRVEQCGNGAVYCQLFDTIFGDVPLSKVKFDATSEYQFLQNFKVLQSVFTRHKLDRAFNAEKLAKCRLQDNLEFLQWTRKYWDSNYDGQPYDAVARRRGAGMRRAPSVASNGGKPSSRMSSTTTTSSNYTSNTSSGGSGYMSSTATSRSSTGARPISRGTIPATGRSSLAPTTNRALTQLQEKNKELTIENQALAEATELVETERDFYFQKLRDIEVLIQTAADQLDNFTDENTNDGNVNVQGQGTAEANVDGVSLAMGKLSVSAKYDQLVKEIQTILYSTAEGFEIPDAADAAAEFETEEEF